jgi:hypothetical protein
MPSPGYIPGPLVIPLTVQVRLVWSLPNGREATNVLHAINAGAVPVNVAMANAIFDFISTSASWGLYAAFLSSETSFVRVDVRDLTSAHLGVFESAGTPVVGTGVGNALPEEVSLVSTLRTGMTGPAHRGRVYWTGFDDSVLDANGHAVADLRTAINNLMAIVIAAFASVGLDLGVAHRGHADYVNARGNTVPAEAAGTDRVLQTDVRDLVFDSQRRRK